MTANEQQTEQQAIEVTANEQQTEQQPRNEPTHLDFTTNMFVACIYNKSWYIGQIDEIDNEEHEVEVNFMEKTKNLYRWPSRKDELWIPYQDILCEIVPPKPSGKSARNLVLSKDDLTKIQVKFDGRN